MTSAAPAIERVVEVLDAKAQRRPPLWEFVEASGLRSLVVCASKNPNAKITMLLVSPVSGQPVLAVKVPTTDAAALAVEAESCVLRDLRRVVSWDTIPRVLGTVDFRGRTGIVMGAVQGTPMATSYLRWRHTARPKQVAADFSAADLWLREFQQTTAGKPAPLEMNDVDVVSSLARRFFDGVRTGEELERLAQIHERLRAQTVPRTAVHGDLWFGNLLLSGGCASGVVDWEAGAVSGEPVRDLVRFAHMYALFLDRRAKPGRRVAGHRGFRADDWGAGVDYALNGTGWFPQLYRGFLREGLARLGASPASWRDAALAGIAEVAALADHEDFARLHLALFRRLAVIQRPSGSLGRKYRSA